MPKYKTIFTDKALGKMKYFGVSEAQAMETFNGGSVERWSSGPGYNSVKKYSGYEIGVAWFQDKKTGQYKITSAWSRKRR